MSYPRINRNKNAALLRRDQHKAFMFGLHRARVTDVNVDGGTIRVLLEDMPYSANIVIPLIGLSMPPQNDSSDKNELRASWGRYIPQVGDLLTVGFGANGELYSLGFHAVYYGGFDKKDEGRESKGGIGWGKSSGKRLKPGDWDFKSARGSSFYMGDKTRLTSGPHSIELNKNSGEVAVTSSLIIDRYGSSESRKGEARRRIFPIDASETSLYNSFGVVAQESIDIVKRGFPQIEMTRTSMGDVIDEDLMIPMISTLGGNFIRRLTSVKDPAGLTDFYSSKVDDIGNYGVEAPTALMFKWVTPLSTWDISNNITIINSTTSYNVTSSIINLSATAQAVIDSKNVQLGGSGAVEFLVKGTTYMGAFNAFLTAIEVATKVVGSSAQNAAALTAIGVAATSLKSSLINVLSTKVKTE